MKPRNSTFDRMVNLGSPNGFSVKQVRVQWADGTSPLQIGEALQKSLLEAGHTGAANRLRWPSQKLRVGLQILGMPEPKPAAPPPPPVVIPPKRVERRVRRITAWSADGLPLESTETVYDA